MLCVLKLIKTDFKLYFCSSLWGKFESRFTIVSYHSIRTLDGKNLRELYLNILIVWRPNFQRNSLSIKFMDVFFIVPLLVIQNCTSINLRKIMNTKTSRCKICPRKKGYFFPCQNLKICDIQGISITSPTHFQMHHPSNYWQNYIAMSIGDAATKKRYFEYTGCPKMKLALGKHFKFAVQGS